MRCSKRTLLTSASLLHVLQSSKPTFRTSTSLLHALGCSKWTLRTSTSLLHGDPGDQDYFKSDKPRYQSTAFYVYIQIIKLVWSSGTLYAGLEQENVLYAQLNTKLMVDHLSFLKPTRPKLLQIGQTRHQSAPFYVYIQNIKLVWHSGTLCAGLEQENVLYAPLNTKSTVDRFGFFKPVRPKLLQIGQPTYQSAPFYAYIQNIKLVWNSGTLCAGLEQENVLYAPLNTKSTIDRFNFGTLCAGLEQENVLYAPPNTKSMVDHLSFFKPTRPRPLQIGQARNQSTPFYLYIQNIKLVWNSDLLGAEL